MIFNFTRNHQFTTRLQEDDTNIEVVSEIKLLGTWITNDLKWDINTKKFSKKSICKNAFVAQCSQIYKKQDRFKKHILYIHQTVLEQSATVWHSSLTQDNKDDLDRVQKSAVRVIMGGRYIDYKNSLQELDMDELEVRREKLCHKMAQKICQTPQVKHMFPIRKEYRNEKRRHTNKYKISKANTTRYIKSAIPHMQQILNEHDKKQRMLLS